MCQDEIVDEIRQVRDELAKQFDYDLDAMFDYLKKKEIKNGRNYVSLPPKRVQIKSPAETARGLKDTPQSSKE